MSENQISSISLQAPKQFPRLWYCSMCNAGSMDILAEKMPPILPYLDGLVWVVHNPCENDPGRAYLEANKGAGKIITRDFVYRHAYSMNETLFAGVIEEGDLVMWTELLEYPPASFVSQIKTQINRLMLENDIDCLYYYGKPYIFRYSEDMEYTGVLHYGFKGARRPYEFSQSVPDESKVRMNMRPVKRTDPLNWVNHYLKYYVEYPKGGNQCLLGLEKNGDPAILFPPREDRRIKFRAALRAKGIPRTVAGVMKMLKEGLPEDMKSFFREEKILCDVYRLHVLGDKTIKDDHDLKDLVKIP
jgi:hypothetical protein